MCNGAVGADGKPIGRAGPDRVTVFQHAGDAPVNQPSQGGVG